MDDDKIYEILNFILGKIGKTKLVWRLEGSANLRVLGMEVSVRDLDIVTDKDGFDFFRKRFVEFFVKEEYSKEKKQHNLSYKLFNEELEILLYENSEESMFNDVENKTWRGLKLKVLPLRSAKRFYELIKRPEKVKLINMHLEKK